MYQPYIGITGLVTSREVGAVVAAMPVPSTRLLMVGVLASSRTLRGLKDRWPHRYPNVNNIAEIFPSRPLTLNLLHYNTKEPETLSRQLVELTLMGGPDLHGHQLNMAWPPVTELREYRRQYPGMQIVLQMNERAFQMVNFSPRHLVERLSQEYAGLVDRILLDRSAGYGMPLDPEWLRNYIEALLEADWGISLGVAGGLSPTSLDLVETLVKDFPDLSIDAESRLRDRDDHLDIARARDYIDKAFQLFGY